MEFKINETINGGVISLYIDDIKQGYIAYSFEKDDVMNVNTTYVNPELRGQGLASKLFDEFKQGVEYVKYLDDSLEC